MRTVAHASATDLGVTADTPLAMRDLLAPLRDAGVTTRGPAPFADRDRSAFLQALDEAIQRVRRGR